MSATMSAWGVLRIGGGMGELIGCDLVIVLF